MTSLNIQEHYQSQFGNAIDNLAEGFQLISYDWRYLYLNDAAINQSHFTREELIGYSMTEKFPGIEKTKLFETLKQCMKERLDTSFENCFEFPDKKLAWFELRIHPVTEGLLIISIDITQRRKEEEEKKNYIKNLEKMIQLTSREIRQPVTNILGIVNQLDDAGNSPEEMRLINRYIRQSATALDTFTKELSIYIESLHKLA